MTPVTVPPRGFRAWSGREVAEILSAVDVAVSDMAASLNTDAAHQYRAGYVAALRSVATGFGLEYEVQHIPRVRVIDGG